MIYQEGPTRNLGRIITVALCRIPACSFPLMLLWLGFPSLVVRRILLNGTTNDACRARASLPNGT